MKSSTKFSAEYTTEKSTGSGWSSKKFSITKNGYWQSSQSSRSFFQDDTSTFICILSYVLRGRGDCWFGLSNGLLHKYKIDWWSHIYNTLFSSLLTMEQRTLKNVNYYLNTNIYTYLETSGGQSSNLYLNVVHFFNTRVK